jgi:HAD superfamily hydrolase (TIGR01509 family)
MTNKNPKIKAIFFDLDGCLLSTKEIHYEALNAALRKIDEKYVITKEEHLTTFDGLPTMSKLKMLGDLKGLPFMHHQSIFIYKQQETVNAINSLIKPDERLIEILKQLKKDGLIIYVCTNSIRKTAKLMVLRLGLTEFVDIIITNEDVKNPKPHPEIYLNAMIKAGVKPSESLIIEDSIHGRQAATDSGGILCSVNKPEDITYELIKSFIDSKSIVLNKKWKDKNINILVPMAGLGSRFSSANYIFPKPLIEVRDKPMIQVVINNLNIEANFIYLVQKAHYEQYNLKYLLNLITPNCTIVQVDGLTEGAACTTLLAKELINNHNPLVIANSDQFMEWNSNGFYYSLINDKMDGSIVTFTATHSKWSFVKLDEDKYVTEVAEKTPISNIATTGIYGWSKGSDYVKYAEQMISKNIRVNNEFYVAVVYNEAILDGKKIKTYDIDKMWGIGDPDSLNYFLNKYDGNL